MQKPLILIVSIIAIIAAIVVIQRTKAQPSAQTSGTPETLATAAQDKAGKYPQAIELNGATGYVNTGDLKLKGLIGKKVVLLDFWTYSCINCQRTIPYLNAWYKKYGDQGLEIIGVHTPEFEFEKNLENVRQATVKLGIKYPVVLDSNYAIWNSYANQYWPHEYLIDIDGYVAHDHIGEGGYDDTEKEIQALLAERAMRLHLANMGPQNITQPSDIISVSSDQPLSPETYFGSARNQYLANGKSGVAGVQTLMVPARIDRDKLYLGGSWDIQPEYATSTANSTITYKFFAKSLYTVAMSDQMTNVTVLLDGKPLTSANAGADVVIKNGQSSVMIGPAQLYKLITAASYGEHTLELRINKPNVKAFTFTFG